MVGRTGSRISSDSGVKLSVPRQIHSHPTWQKHMAMGVLEFLPFSRLQGAVQADDNRDRRGAGVLGPTDSGVGGDSNLESE